MVRAPNRGPLGLRIPDVQAFNWQTSDGISVLNAGTFRIQRRLVKGIGGGVTYTLAKSMDNASNIGGGADGRRAERPGSRGRVGALELRPAAPGIVGSLVRAAVRAEQALAAQRRADGGGARRTGAARRTSPGSRARRLRRASSTRPATSRAAPTARCAPTTTATSSRCRTRRSSDFFNTARVLDPGRRHLRQRAAQPDHRSGQPPAQRAVVARHADGRQPRRHAPGRRRPTCSTWSTSPAIDTVVNSPTFGQVLSVRPMRSAQLNFRFRF